MGEDCIKFASLGDWGNGNDKQYQVGQLLANLINDKEIEFICGLGDNIYPNGLTSLNYQDELNEKFIKPFSKCQSPFYMVLGNHDYYGIASLQIEKVPKIEPRWIMPNEYYDFIMETNKVKGHFICFDSNYNFYKKEDWLKQLKWIESRLKKYNKSSTWTILIGHHPWKSYGYHGNAQSILKDFYERITNKYNIDFILNGHEHDKQLIVTKNKTKQVVCGTGSVIREFPERINQASNLRFQSETIGICQIKLYKNKANLYFLDEYGKIEFQSLFLPKSITNKK